MQSTWEKRNKEDGFVTPKTLTIPELCQNCYRGISFRSLASQAEHHPEDCRLMKCEYHNCWVPDNGRCADYSFKMTDKQ